MLELAARIRVPASLDPPAARFAVMVLGFYRRFLSARSGRTCLFRISCSRFAADRLSELGWNDGVAGVRDRVRSCGGAFTVASDVSGNTVLLTCDGAAVPHADLSDAAACLCRPGLRPGA